MPSLPPPYHLRCLFNMDLLLSLHFFNRSSEDISADPYLHQDPEFVRKVEHLHLIGKDGQIRVDDVIVRYDCNNNEHKKGAPVPLEPRLPLGLGDYDTGLGLHYRPVEFGEFHLKFGILLRWEVSCNRLPQ